MEHSLTTWMHNPFLLIFKFHIRGRKCFGWTGGLLIPPTYAKKQPTLTDCTCSRSVSLHRLYEPVAVEFTLIIAYNPLWQKNEYSKLPQPECGYTITKDEHNRRNDDETYCTLYKQGKKICLSLQAVWVQTVAFMGTRYRYNWVHAFSLKFTRPIKSQVI